MFLQAEAARGNEGPCCATGLCSAATQGTLPGVCSNGGKGTEGFHPEISSCAQNVSPNSASACILRQLESLSKPGSSKRSSLG